MALGDIGDLDSNDIVLLGDGDLEVTGGVDDAVGRELRDHELDSFACFFVGMGQPAEGKASGVGHRDAERPENDAEDSWLEGQGLGQPRDLDDPADRRTRVANLDGVDLPRCPEEERDP